MCAKQARTTQHRVNPTKLTPPPFLPCFFSCYPSQQRAVAFIEELERLKVLLLAKDISQPQAHTYRRPADARRIEDSATIKDIDWSAAAAPAAGAAAAAAAAAGMFGASGAASAPPLPAGSLDLGADLEWPPRTATTAAAAAGSQIVSTSAPAGTAAGGSVGQPWQEPLSYSSRYRPSDAQLRQKHSLFAPRTGSGAGSWQQEQQQQAASRVRYPSFNSNPIDAVWATAPPAAAAAAGASSGGGAPDIGSLSLLEQQQRLLMQPSAGPSLGPQEIEVQNMLPCQGQAGGTCAAPPPLPPSQQQQQQQLVAVSRESTAEAAAAAAAGPKSLSKRVDLRDVHISVALLNDFLHYAASNTRR
jgi:hypothetical protein